MKRGFSARLKPLRIIEKMCIRIALPGAKRLQALT